VPPNKAECRRFDLVPDREQAIENLTARGMNTKGAQAVRGWCIAGDARRPTGGIFFSQPSTAPQDATCAQ